jgi:dTMP kinase
MAPESEALILNASRAELVDKILERGLADGRLIVCDRFWDATLAYQGFGRGLPIDTLLTISMFAARRLQPDLTFLLDVTPSVSRERLRSRTAIPDRMERESSAFHERVADGYRRLAAAEPHRFVTIDGTKEEEEIAVEVRQIVLSRWQSTRL